jgi:hypothetical protein
MSNKEITDLEMERNRLYAERAEEVDRHELRLRELANEAKRDVGAISQFAVADGLIFVLDTKGKLFVSKTKSVFEAKVVTKERDLTWVEVSSPAHKDWKFLETELEIEAWQHAKYLNRIDSRIKEVNERLAVARKVAADGQA